MYQRIEINGPIGSAVTAASVSSALSLFDKTQAVQVEINSDGGSVREAVAILSTLKSWPGGVEVTVTGWALSAASLVAMAGRTIRMAPSALMMIHAPWMGTEGNAEDLRAQAAVLDQVAAAMLAAYRRCGQPDAVILGWLTDGADHWFTADEALALGLAEAVIAEPVAPTSPLPSAAGCRHPIPSHILLKVAAMNAPAARTTPTAPQINADAIRAEGIQAERRRRTEINAQFDQIGDRWGDMSALRRRCEDDANCTADIAAQRILAVCGGGAGPIGSVPPEPGEHFGIYATPRRAAGRSDDFRAACTDALLMRAGLAVKNPHPAVRDVRGLSVVAMAENCLSMSGRSVRDLGSNDAKIRAALSTSDFPALLSNTMGKALSGAYEEIHATHVGWTAEREALDFKPQTLAMLSEAPDLDKVLEYGEYQHGNFSDSANAFKVETFGKLVQISRQALVNDDLTAFTAIPAALGAAARRLESDLVYAALTSTANLGDGAPLFHTSHGNLAATPAGLSLTTLGVARAAMRRQRGIAGKSFIDPRPAFLIVPAEMETFAEALLSDLRHGAKGDTVGAEWVRSLTLVADPRLDAVSATAWYLAASPQQIPGITRVYLQGTERPHLAEEEGFSVDATKFKVRLDVGVGVLDFRALFKNAGA